MRRVQPWIVLLIGLSFAAAVAYALPTVDGPAPISRGAPARPAEVQDTPVAQPRSGDAAPRDQIGDASRAALREVLREADENGS